MHQEKKNHQCSIWVLTILVCKSSFALKMHIKNVHDLKNKHQCYFWESQGKKIETQKKFQPNVEPVNQLLMRSTPYAYINVEHTASSLLLLIVSCKVCNENWVVSIWMTPRLRCDKNSATKAVFELRCTTKNQEKKTNSNLCS